MKILPAQRLSLLFRSLISLVFFFIFFTFFNLVFQKTALAFCNVIHVFYGPGVYIENNCPSGGGCHALPGNNYKYEVDCYADGNAQETVSEGTHGDCSCSGGEEKPLNGIVLLPDGVTRWLAEEPTDCSYDKGAGGRGGNVTSSVGSLSWVWDDTNKLWFYNISSAPDGTVTSTLTPPTACGYTCDYSFVWDSADWTEVPNSKSLTCSTTFNHDSTRGELIAHVLKPIPQPKPNLTVSDLAVNPSDPELNGAHTVTANVVNDGKVDINNTQFNNQIYLDGSATAISGKDISINTLSKNGTTTITFTELQIATAGNHTYKVCTDTGNTIDESNENQSDNCAEVTFEIEAVRVWGNIYFAQDIGDCPDDPQVFVLTQKQSWKTSIEEIVSVTLYRGDTIIGTVESTDSDGQTKYNFDNYLIPYSDASSHSISPKMKEQDFDILYKACTLPPKSFLAEQSVSGPSVGSVYPLQDDIVMYTVETNKWFQAFNGGVHFNSDLSVNVLDRFALIGKADDPPHNKLANYNVGGLVSSGGSVVITGGKACMQDFDWQASELNRNLENPYNSKFFGLIQSPDWQETGTTITNIDFTKPAFSDEPSISIDLTNGYKQETSGGKQYNAFVFAAKKSGATIYIDNDIIANNPDKITLIIISNGNIVIDPSVTTIDAALFAAGTITFTSNGKDLDVPIIVTGGVYAGNINFNRDLKDIPQYIDLAAERVLYNPAMIALSNNPGMHESIKITNSYWVLTD